MTTDALKPLDSYDFFRCRKCHRLLTSPDVRKALGASSTGATGKPCPCGSATIIAANLPWYGWLLPRVLRFAYRRLRGQA